MDETEQTTGAFAPCSLCGADAPPGGHEHREVRGWERRRSGGGLHGIAGRTVTGRVACNACMSRVRLKIDSDQGTLL